MFEGYVKFDYIQELVNDLQEQCYEWSGNSNNINDWYDEDLYDAVTSSEQPFSKFVESIDGIKMLAKGEFKDKQKNICLASYTLTSLQLWKLFMLSCLLTP